MKQLIYYTLLLLNILLLSTCKRYDEGGLTCLFYKHLFGKNEVDASKTWKLNKYEVNGIDSTFLIQGGANDPDFYNKFITFKYTRKGDPTPYYEAYTSFYKYSGKIDYKVDKIFTVGMPILTHEDSTQCKNVNGIISCQRNLFYPDFIHFKSMWYILKLKKNELIIKAEMNNSVTIKLYLTY